jgi:hypothetical protein
VDEFCARAHFFARLRGRFGHVASPFLAPEICRFRRVRVKPRNCALKLNLSHAVI